MLDYSRELEIAAPPAAVWAVMGDVVRWHEWTPSIARIEALDGEELQIGRRYRVHQPKLPPAVWRVTVLRPGEGFEWESTAPGAHIVGRHWIVPTPDGCRVELGIRYAGWLGNVIGWLFRNISVRYVGLEAEGLKRRCEATR